MYALYTYVHEEYIYTHTHIYMYVYMYVCMYVCTYVKSMCVAHFRQ